MINIIIPCYNSRETLPNTLNSLISQTQHKFLVTIVDDGSEEKYDDIIENYNKKLNIKYIKLDDNYGAGMARQVGIESCGICEYLMFLDSDDMLMPQAIENLSRECNIHKPDILVSSFIQQNKYGIDRVISSKDPITWVHGKVYKSSFLKENNIHFPIDIRLNEDAAFNTIAFNMTDNIYKTSDITTLWVDNKKSITRRDENFSILCIPQYIECQIYAINFLLNKNRANLDTISSSIVYMYNYYQVSIAKNIPFTDNQINKLRNFIKRIEDIGMFKNEKFIKNLINRLNEQKISYEFQYFEKQTFKQWLEEYGVILDENNSN